MGRGDHRKIKYLASLAQSKAITTSSVTIEKKVAGEFLDSF